MEPKSPISSEKEPRSHMAGERHARQQLWQVEALGKTTQNQWEVVGSAFKYQMNTSALKEFARSASGIRF